MYKKSAFIGCLMSLTIKGHGRFCHWYETK